MNIKKGINKKLIFIFIAAIVFVFSFSGFNKMEASDIASNKITIVSENFNKDDGFWYPGRTLSKEFTIKNGFDSEIEFDKFSVNIESVNNFILKKVYNPDEDIYKDFLKHLQVKMTNGDNVIFDGTFEDFNKQGVLLSSPIKIAANSEKKYSLSLHLNEDTGNIFQNLQDLFNISIQYNLNDNINIFDSPVPTGSITNNITNLPQTGGFLNFTFLMSLGLFFLGLGFLIIAFYEKKKKENLFSKGGN